jgi:Tfp pilus assembly protein PilN
MITETGGDSVMGFFWNLLQQSQISEQHQRAKSLEERVSALEEELEKTQKLLVKTLQALEEYTNYDIDGDGKIGR